MLKQVQHDGSVERMELPDRYPLASASREEVISWAYAAKPPFELVRQAAPWLKTNDQVRWYCEGIREALENPGLVKAVGELFGPALGEIRASM